MTDVTEASGSVNRLTRTETDEKTHVEVGAEHGIFSVCVGVRRDAEADYGHGVVVVRLAYSGTEPLLRIVVDGDEPHCFEGAYGVEVSFYGDRASAFADALEAAARVLRGRIARAVEDER